MTSFTLPTVVNQQKALKVRTSDCKDIYVPIVNLLIEGINTQSGPAYLYFKKQVVSLGANFNIPMSEIFLVTWVK